PLISCGEMKCPRLSSSYQVLRPFQSLAPGNGLRRVSLFMAGAGRGGTELMSVSIIAGPASNAVLEKFGPVESKRFEVFQPSPRSKPEEIVARLRSIAEKGEVAHFIIQCETERPLMAYAFLFA